MGYRDYTHGVLPWQERATPFSGSEDYEQALRREYLRGLYEENRQLEAERGAFRRMEREQGRADDLQNQALPTFFNKDINRQDKYFRRAGLGMGKAAGAAADKVSHHVSHHVFSWADNGYEYTGSGQVSPVKEDQPRRFDWTRSTDGNA